MRFLLLMLATAASALACEKDPALSNTTNNLSPAARPEATRLAVGSAAASTSAATVAAPTIANSANPTIANSANPTIANSKAKPEAVTPAIVAPPVAAATPVSEPTAMAKPVPVPADRAKGSIGVEEGNGEPMDDVDDEIVPVTDKSGVDNPETEEGPSRPVDDDPAAADIDIRE
jgi:hypothetical protein